MDRNIMGGTVSIIFMIGYEIGWLWQLVSFFWHGRDRNMMGGTVSIIFLSVYGEEFEDSDSLYHILTGYG